MTITELMKALDYLDPHTQVVVADYEQANDERPLVEVRVEQDPPRVVLV